MIAGQIYVQGSQRGPHLRGGANGTKSVVLMKARDAKDGHNCVADELLHGTAVPTDHHLHLVEVTAHQPPERLRIKTLPQRGGPGYVGEYDGDDFAGLPEGLRCAGQRRGAALAEPSAIRVLITTRRANLHVEIVGVGRLCRTRLGWFPPCHASSR